jgi:aminopeptidase N
VTNVYHEPIDVFDRHLYEKGGCVLHMLRRTLGDARFKRSLAVYIGRHERGSVETRDLARAVEAATGWNPDRFFEQWVFTGGHPELSAEIGWDEGQKLVRVALTQKQETPFHLPLVIRVVAGETRDHEVVLEEKQQVFLLPTGVKPTQVIVDPGNHLLKTYEEKKPDDWTRTELLLAERAIDRVRAARSLGRSGEPTQVAALAEAMAKDSHWTVRGEAALALGAIKTGEARDQIAAALPNEKHPKARRQLVRALGSVRNDEKAADAAQKVLAGDASYFVEGEAALSLAKTRSPRAFDQLREAMKRPSYLDTIRSSALSGLGELRDERGIDVALAAARYGEPVIARRAAIGALGSLAGEHAGRKRQVRETLEELLDDPDFRARIAAVEALRTLGDPASVGALGRAEQKDLDGRVRRRAREVIRAIHENAQQPEAVKTLRDSVEKLEEQNRQLQERLRKIETRLETK